MVGPRSLRRAVYVGVVSIGMVTAISCGDDSGESSSDATAASVADTALAEFADDADAVCARMPQRFEQLTDPDGEGGQKPRGLGRVVEAVFTELGRVRPPAEHTARWDEAIGLLIESGRVLTDAEELAAAGDDAVSDAAQSRALFELQPAAHELLDQIKAPFEVCFVE